MRAAYPDIEESAVWDKICVIDSENESGSLYVGTKIGNTQVGEYLTINLGPPFSAQRYLEAITLAEESDVEFLVIDSLSHAWTGEGGMLDVQAKASQRSGNSYTAWREVTPWHNKLVDKILQCNMHVAMTLRSKVEYAIEENERGKKSPRKIGMAPVFREGISYETTVFFELSQDHTACASKDRTGLFDGQYFIISPNTGAVIHTWLQQSAPAEPTTPDAKKAAPQKAGNLADTVDEAIRRHCEGMNQQEKQAVVDEIREITGGVSNYRSVTDPEMLKKLLQKYKETEDE